MEELTEMCVQCKVADELKSSLCSVCLTQRVMNGKWKIVIIFLLKDGPLRFSKIKKSLPKVTQAYLSAQLKEMEHRKLIARYSYNEVPPKVEYSLTDEGKEFLSIVENMQQWGNYYMQKNF